MDKPMEHYQNLRLSEMKKALEANNFGVYIAEDAAQAAKIVMEDIIPQTGAKSISWGGSMTVVAAGLYHTLKDSPDFQIVDTYDRTISMEESMERRRQGMMVDLFITGTNAITEAGQLVNLDMLGNRVASLTFGPRHVVVLAGINKIVPDLDDAMFRVKNIAAPINAARLDKKTPCVKTSFCEECKSPDRICNTWTVTEKSFPKGRVKIVLIKENLGF
jgi:L-lactate utilization protein LutB